MNKLKFFCLSFIFSSNLFLNISFNLENLDYFSDFNNKKMCTFHEDEKDPVILEDIDSALKGIFKNKFEEKIKEKQNNFNLLTYDMIHIFDNYLFNYRNCIYKKNYIPNFLIQNF